MEFLALGFSLAQYTWRMNQHVKDTVSASDILPNKQFFLFLQMEVLDGAVVSGEGLCGVLR